MAPILQAKVAAWAEVCGGQLLLGCSGRARPMAGYPPVPGTDDIDCGGGDWDDAAAWAAAALADSGTVKGAQRAIEKAVRPYGRVRSGGECCVLISVQSRALGWKGDSESSSTGSNQRLRGSLSHVHEGTKASGGKWLTRELLLPYNWQNDMTRKARLT